VQDIRNTLNENLDFYREQERLISVRLALLPKGRIKAKKIGRGTYYYLHYRKGKGFKSDYLGKGVPPELREQLKERIRLEKELRRVREGLRLLRSAPRKETDLTEPLRSILRTLTKEGLWESGLEIIGSWCFLLYQKHLPIEKYPVKTEDLNILIPLPFRGKPFDLGSCLKGLGFRQDFHADGSMSFSGNMMKVDFLSPEKGSGERPAQFMRELAVTPQSLRFVEMLFSEPIVLNVARGIRARVPSPAAFSLHKLLIATRPKRREKGEKDIRQAVFTAKYVLSDRAEMEKMLKLWASFPKSWKDRVRLALRTARKVVPLEPGLIQRLVTTLS
jgi:hypothetical protein